MLTSWMGLKGEIKNIWKTMPCHWLKIWRKFYPLNIDRLTFNLFVRCVVMGCKKEGQRYIEVYYKKSMLLSCTWTVMQRCTCLNVLEIIWSSSCKEWGLPLNNTSRTGMVNVGWVITPFPYPFTGKFVTLCTNYTILSMFLPGLCFTMELSLMTREENYICSNAFF